jgi:hypothetical protein
MKRLKAFGLFWWDFVVGDDWRMAAGVIVLLAVSALIAHQGVPIWWLPPLVVVALLGYSLARAVRR